MKLLLTQGQFDALVRYLGESYCREHFDIYPKYIPEPKPVTIPNRRDRRWS